MTSMTLCYYCLGKLPEWPTYHRDSYLKRVVMICTACEGRFKIRRDTNTEEDSDITDCELDTDFDSIEDK